MTPEQAEKIKGSKYIAMLPQSTKPWKIMSNGGYVYALNQEHSPLCLYEDGWKPLDFKPEDHAEMEKIIANAKREALLDIWRPAKKQ